MAISLRMMPRSLGTRSKNGLPPVASKRTLRLIHILSSYLMINIEKQSVAKWCEAFEVEE